MQPWLAIVLCGFIVAASNNTSDGDANITSESNDATTTANLFNQTAAELTGVTFNGPGDLQALISALGLNSSIVLACLVAFAILRLRFPLVYSNRQDDDGVPSTSATSCGKFIDWVKLSIYTTDEEAIRIAGLDSTLLRSFCTLGASILGAIAIPMCIIVVPLNAAFGEANLQEDPLRMLEMATIRQNHPWLYYLHAAVVWLVCFTVHFFIDQALKKFLKFRMKWMEAVPIPQSTTVLVEAVPADWRSDGKLKMFFQKVFSSDDVVAAHLVKHEHDLAKLLAKRDSLLQLQRKAQQVFEKTQKVDTFRQCPCGKRVETLPYCEGQLQGMDENIQQLRHSHAEERLRDPMARSSASGFVTFSNRRFADMAQSLRISSDQNHWKVSAAPEASDIRWGDLRRSSEFSTALKTVGYLFVLGLYVGFMPIVIFITNVAELVDLGPMQPLWAGFAPTLGLTLFLALLTTVLVLIFQTFFCLKANAYAQHKLQWWYFTFQLIFVVLVTTIGRSLVSQFQAVLESPTSVFDILANSLPKATHFYMTYLILQWTKKALEILRYMNLSKFLFFKTFCTSKEAKEKAEPEDQASQGLGARNVNLAVSFVLGLLFSSVAPLLSIFAMLDLILGRLIYGYLVIHAETRKPDLGGEFWVSQVHFAELALGLYCILMIGVLSQMSESYAWMIAAPSLLLVVWSAWHHRKTYQWRQLPFEELVTLNEDPKEAADVIGECYIQPELADTTQVTCVV